MGKKTEDKELILSYEIYRKDVAKDALKKFYKNPLQMLLGPGFVVLGFILGKSVQGHLYGVLSNLLVAIGAFYTVFPYVVLFFNMRKVRNSKLDFYMMENKISMEDKRERVYIKYGNIGCVFEEDGFIKVLPKEGNGEFIKEIYIPIKKITYGCKEDIINRLQEKIGGPLKQKESLVEEYDEGSSKKIRTVLKFSIDKEDMLEFTKMEYYALKRNKVYGIIFALLAGLTIFSSIGLGVSFLLLAMLYIFYPYVIAFVKNRNMRFSETTFDLCEHNRIGIINSSIQAEVPASCIKITQNNEYYMKIYIPIKRGLIFYVPKEKILEGTSEQLLRVLPKSSIINNKGKTKKK